LHNATIIRAAERAKDFAIGLQDVGVFRLQELSPATPFRQRALRSATNGRELEEHKVGKFGHILRVRDPVFAEQAAEAPESVNEF
jgi:hypothetical protein